MSVLYLRKIYPDIKRHPICEAYAFSYSVCTRTEDSAIYGKIHKRVPIFFSYKNLIL